MHTGGTLLTKKDKVHQCCGKTRQLTADKTMVISLYFHLYFQSVGKKHEHHVGQIGLYVVIIITSRIYETFECNRGQSRSQTATSKTTTGELS
jgi:hypothetical protein